MQSVFRNDMGLLHHAAPACERRQQSATPTLKGLLPLHASCVRPPPWRHARRAAADSDKTDARRDVCRASATAEGLQAPAGNAVVNLETSAVFSSQIQNFKFFSGIFMET